MYDTRETLIETLKSILESWKFQLDFALKESPNSHAEHEYRRQSIERLDVTIKLLKEGI